MSNTLDKATATIILYFITELDGILGKTHLQKLLFLTELLASKKFKEKLTNIDFKLYHYGPFSAQVDQYTQYLQQKSLIRIDERSFINEPQKKYVRYFAAKKTPVKQSIAVLIGSDKALLLDEVVSSFGNISLRELLDVVYGIQLVQSATKDERIDFLDAAQTTREEPEDAEEAVDLFEDIK